MWQWLVVMVLLDVVAWGQPTCTAGGRAPVFFLCLKLCTWLFSDQNLINKKHFGAHIGQHRQMMSYLESLQSNSSCTCIRWDEETTIIGIVTFFRKLLPLLPSNYSKASTLCVVLLSFSACLRGLLASSCDMELEVRWERLRDHGMTFTTTPALPLNVLPLYWPNTVTVSKVMRCYKFQLVWLWERSICDSLMMNVSLSVLTFSQPCPLSWYNGDFTLAYWNPAFLPALFALISCSL